MKSSVAKRVGALPGPQRAGGVGPRWLAGPERDESPGGAFKATFPTAGRDVREKRFAHRQFVRRSLGAGGPHPVETSRFILFLFRSPRNAGLCYFLRQKKVTKD